MRFLNYFRNRGVLGFYLPLVGSARCLISSFVYLGFMSSRYFNILPFVFTILGSLLFFLLSAFKATSRFASFPLFGLVFAGFLVFIYHSYLYFSEAFYSGFSLEALFGMDFCFLFPLFGWLSAIVLSEFGLYADSHKKEQRNGKAVMNKEAN